jgi:hypothetical protein
VVKASSNRSTQVHHSDSAERLDSGRHAYPLTPLIHVSLLEKLIKSFIRLSPDLLDIYRPKLHCLRQKFFRFFSTIVMIGHVLKDLFTTCFPAREAIQLQLIERTNIYSIFVEKKKIVLFFPEFFYDEVLKLDTSRWLSVYPD